MLILKPIVHNTIWGGKRILKLTGAGDDSTGHLYSVYARPEMSNLILNGIYAGRTLNDTFTLWRNDAGMNEYDYFPLTIALTEADLNLSIQVHPDDFTARTLEHKARGKRESWYFIEPPSEGYIINGCTCTSEEEKNFMLGQKKYLEMSGTLKVSRGDYVFVEPGTLHSITAGSLVYEVEEGADFTYRFYDYDRRDKNGNTRELHTEKAALALNISLKSEVKRYTGQQEIKEKTYATKKIENADSYANDSENIQCFTLIKGRAECEGTAITPGMTAILWPGDSVSGAEIELAFSARMRRNIE